MSKAHKLFLWIILCFLCTDFVQADIYDKLNAERSKVGLPMLTRNPTVDFRMFVYECNNGIKYSCFLAQQLQQHVREQQQSEPVHSTQEKSEYVLPPLRFKGDPRGPAYIPPTNNHCNECRNYNGSSNMMKAFCADYMAHSTICN